MEGKKIEGKHRMKKKREIKLNLIYYFYLPLLFIAMVSYEIPHFTRIASLRY